MIYLSRVVQAKVRFKRTFCPLYYLIIVGYLRYLAPRESMLLDPGVCLPSSVVPRYGMSHWSQPVRDWLAASRVTMFRLVVTKKGLQEGSS